MKFKFKTEGLTGESLSLAEKMNGLFEGMPEGITSTDVQTQIKGLFEGFFGVDDKLTFNAEAFKSLTDQMDDTKEGTLKFILKAQGVELANLKSKLPGALGSRRKSLVEALEEKKTQFADIRKAKSGNIEIKLKSVTSITGSVSTPTIPADPYAPMPVDTGEFVDIALPALFILDAIDKGETSSPSLLWTEQSPTVFGAAIVAEGAVKPYTTKKAVRRVSQYGKIAAIMTITDELDKDMPKLATEFRRLFTDEVMRTQHNQILTDILAIAPGYVQTSMNGLIQSPDNYGAIAAAVSQIQALNFEPDFLAINPTDFWIMNQQKDSLGRYNIPPFVSIDMGDMKFAQLKLVVNPAITAGSFLVGQAKTYKVDIYEDYTLRIGFINDDFARNQYSGVGEIKYHSYIATNRINAWCSAQFSVVKALIAIAPAA